MTCLFRVSNSIAYNGQLIGEGGIQGTSAQP